jgi:hypothetical protein
MVKIEKDQRSKLRAIYDRFLGNRNRLLEEITPEIAKLYMRKLREKQPIGKIDPLYDLWPHRNARPSIRQGLTPIESGWLPPTIRKEGGGARIIRIQSESWHIQFFTKMTGRNYLGTKVTQPQRPTGGKKTLYFWGNRLNREVWPQMTHAPGFKPKTDFVKEAADEVGREIHNEGMARLKVTLIQSARGLFS